MNVLNNENQSHRATRARIAVGKAGTKRFCELPKPTPRGCRCIAISASQLLPCPAPLTLFCNGQGFSSQGFSLDGLIGFGRARCARVFRFIDR